MTGTIKKKHLVFLLLIPLSLFSGILQMIEQSGDIIFKTYIIESNSIKMVFPGQPTCTMNKSIGTNLDSYSYFHRTNNNLFILTAADYGSFPQTDFIYQNTIAEYEKKFNVSVSSVRTFKYGDKTGIKARFKNDKVRVDMKILFWGEILYTWSVLSSGLERELIEEFLDSFEIIW